MIITWEEKFDLNLKLSYHHEKQLAESSELAQRRRGGEEEERERDLDYVRRLK